MTKKICGLALAAFIMTLGANAQTPGKSETTACDKAKTECTSKGCDKKQKGERTCFMKDLNLSDAQKAKLKEINEGYQTEVKALREQSMKEGHAKKDSLKKDMGKKMKDLKRKKLNDMKAILTADQYIQFLEENYIASNPQKHMKKEFSKGMKHAKPAKAMEGHKKGGHKHQKGNK